MTYEIVFSTESIDDIVTKVNDMIAEGWKPQGGISVTSHIFSSLGDTPTVIYTQAMIKE